MKLITLGMAGISTLIGLTLMTAVTAAEPADDERRPAFEGQRGQGPGRMGGRFGQRRGPDLAGQLERMDTNNDDKISEAEFVEFRLGRLDEMFERRDRNDDGLIAVDENSRPEPGRRRNRANRPDIDREEVVACVQDTFADFAPNADMNIEERFENVDTNGDGSLTLAEVGAELEARAPENFARFDTDSDGFITEAELEAHRQARLDVRREVRECVRGLV